jgi:hypothetical protein
MLKSTRFNVLYLLIAMLGVITLHDVWTASREVSAISYSEFRPYLRFQAGIPP